jgi:aminopeptidase N
MESLPSLTRNEAVERAALIAVQRYDIEVDLTDLVEGADFRAVTTIRFSCREPGASTFVDAALTVVSATLNGRAIPDDQVGGARIQLTDLAAENVLVVETVQSETAEGEWVHRAVDPSDKEVYVWTSFEPDDARRAWACFDQPDLKAPHGFSVLAPAAWRVVSNSGDPTVTPEQGGRRWRFPDTPPLSTYVPVICAGPFYEVRSERAGYDLGLLCRQSLSRFLDRDAEELFELTAQGLTFFGDRFGLRFPQHKYDQAFLPEMGGAMENYGCVTWSDVFVYRTAPTYSEREFRALVLLHEMAHMWFGDMVTMAWWEDLWLNEAFAEWACYWSAEGATEFRDAWSSFLVSDKMAGYSADLAPSTHPIRQPVEDVAAAVANFDDITYPKGASVLKQLFAFVGDDACVAGLRGYFSRYAWGNTRLADLIGELERASGRDLSQWSTGWLDTAGTDRLALDTDSGGATILRASGPAGIAPRSHRLNIGLYDREDGADGQPRLIRRESIPVETAGTATPLPSTVDAAVVVVNDDDLTFASVRPDGPRLPALLESVGQLPSAVSRAVAITTAWDMVVRSELSAAEFVGAASALLRVEQVDGLVEPCLSLGVEAADQWSSAAHRDRLLERVADLCLDLSENPLRHQVATRALAGTAVNGEQMARARELAGDDVDLRWRVLARLAEIGSVDQAEVEQLEREDPDPDSWIRALCVDASRPDPQAKETAWRAMLDEHRVPMGALRMVSRAFWRRSQDELLAPYAQRYLSSLPTLHLGGMIPALALSRALYPRAGVAEAYLAQAIAASRGEDVSPAVAKLVVEQTDRLSRTLATHALDRADSE